jgi:hypothetical protein
LLVGKGYTFTPYRLPCLPAAQHPGSDKDSHFIDPLLIEKCPKNSCPSLDEQIGDSFGGDRLQESCQGFRTLIEQADVNTEL